MAIPSIEVTGGPPPLRILQLAAPARYGGLETVVRQLSAGLRQHGHDVLVGCLLDEGDDVDSHPFVAAVRQSGVGVETFCLPHRAYRREVDVIARLAREFRADVVHTHGYHADVVGMWAARRGRVPRVATAHGFIGGGWKNRLYEFVQRRSYRSADAVIAVSRTIADLLSRDRQVAQKIHLLPNAFVRRDDHLSRRAARDYLGLGPAAFVIGWVGRMSREKGPDVVVDALGGDHVPDVTLCLIGDGSLRNSLRSRAATQMQGRAVFPGGILDAGRLLKAFDLFVSSSRTEGTPMVLLEAMDAGVPIIATRVGGIPDVLGPADGVLVPPEDPAALRRAILQMIDEPESAHENAARASERLEQSFGPEPWLNAHEQMYRAAVHSTASEEG